MKYFTPSQDPAEGLGVLMLFRLIEEAMPAFFQPGRPIRIARAPGRLDVMGGLAGTQAPHALSMPTAEAACAAVQARDDDLVRLWSPCRDGSRTQMLSVRLGDLGLPEAPISYPEARAFLNADPRDRWAGYLLGALLVLAREHALTPEHGAEVLLHSDIPPGCGVSASSAITVTMLRAFAMLYGLESTPAECAADAATVEREVLGAAGRSSDAMAVLQASAGELVVLRGPAADFDGSVAVPSDLEFVALATGTGSVDATPESPDPDEPARTARFHELLGREPSPEHRQELGDLMFAAHRAYAEGGHGNAVCDVVVDFVKARRDLGGGVFGAKLSGRGGGGTVVLLGERNKVWYEALRAKKHLLEATGNSAHIFRWSSPGALAFGSIDLEPKPDGEQ